MILVIGGYRQGKLEFAKENLSVADVNDGCFGDADCIYNLGKLVMKPHFDEDMERYLTEHPNCVLICDEVGSGIIPLEKSDREFREKAGRTCCMLAKRADAVYRVFCGIGTKIK